MDEKDNPTVCSKTTEVTAYTLARQNLKTAASRQKEKYDHKAHGEDHKVGDKLWLHSTVIPRSKST